MTFNCDLLLASSRYQLQKSCNFDWSRSKKDFKVTLDNLNCVQGEENEFRVPGDHLKHRFLDFTKVEFWACQEAENDSLVPFDHLNRRLIDLKNSYFR